MGHWTSRRPPFTWRPRDAPPRADREHPLMCCDLLTDRAQSTRNAVSLHCGANWTAVQKHGLLPHGKTVQLRRPARALPRSPAEMTTSLTTARKNLQHPTVKGTAAEAKWTSWPRIPPQTVSGPTLCPGRRLQRERERARISSSLTGSTRHSCFMTETLSTSHRGCVRGLRGEAGARCRLHSIRRKQSASVRNCTGRAPQLLTLVQVQGQSKRGTPHILAGVLALDSSWAKGAGPAMLSGGWRDYPRQSAWTLSAF